MNKEKLDQFTLDIEFLLISVIQGVALAALGSEAVKIVSAQQWQYIPYIIAGFFFILIFWSGAIIHALSFIDWPLDLTHNFFYFLASLLEVITFGFMEDPLHWFLATAVFFVSAEVLYVVDYILITSRKETFVSKAQVKLYNHLLSEQKVELFFLVPAGIIFTLFCFYLIYTQPLFFITQNNQLYLIGLQILFSLGFLIFTTHNFKKRTQLISHSV